MSKIKWFGGAVLGCVVVAGLGSYADGSGSEPTSSAAARPATCQAASAEVLRRLEPGLTIDGGGSIRAVYVAESHDYPGDWYIAGELQGPGLEGKKEIAVWVTGQIAPRLGKPSAADGFADEFSVWDAPAKVGPLQVYPDDAGKDAAIACVKAELKA